MATLATKKAANTLAMKFNEMKKNISESLIWSILKYGRFLCMIWLLNKENLKKNKLKIKITK